MSFVPKKTKKKVEAGYKTIYLRQSLIQKIEQIAKENSTSFNNVVVSMIEHMDEVIKMPDYQAMYHEMVQETERAINILIAAQRRCEEMYINAKEPELIVLEQPPDSQT